jgi:hypothetical protein
VEQKRKELEASVDELPAPKMCVVEIFLEYY